MTVLYWDCSAGIAGNMAVSSLLDLGLDRREFLGELAKIPFPEGPIDAHILDVTKNGIRAVYFNTADDEPFENCENKPGEDKHGRRHAHPHECHPEPDVPDSHTHDEIHTVHRCFADVRALIEGADFPKNVTERALACFRSLAEAEAEVHGATPDTVHFHEVGARDSIADIVGTILCLEKLGVNKVFASPINVGSGIVRCAHGFMPVPAPATALLLRGREIFSSHKIEGELTTPTGAALLRGLDAKNGMPPHFCLKRIGSGAGSKDLPIPNILRAFLGESSDESISSGANIDEDEVVMLETNLDNVTGEILGYAAERLWRLGALDVTMAPLTMKKGRPGIALCVMVPPSLAEQAQSVLFAELPTLGIRRHNVRRAVLKRKPLTIKTDYGEIAAKEVIEADGTKRCVPEYESLRKAALETGIPLRLLISAIRCETE